jgi:hypothetical protein
MMIKFQKIQQINLHKIFYPISNQSKLATHQLMPKVSIKESIVYTPQKNKKVVKNNR